MALFSGNSLALLLVCLFPLQVLRNSHQIEWERRLSVLNSQPILKEWEKTEIRNTVAHTKIREFPPNTVGTAMSAVRPASPQCIWRTLGNEVQGRGTIYKYEVRGTIESKSDKIPSSLAHPLSF